MGKFAEPVHAWKRRYPKRFPVQLVIRLGRRSSGPHLSSNRFSQGFSPTTVPEHAVSQQGRRKHYNARPAVLATPSLGRLVRLNLTSLGSTHVFSQNLENSNSSVRRSGSAK